VRPGMKRCMECSIKEGERVRAQHDARAKAGLCVRCGAPVEDEGRLTCRACREHQKRYNAQNAAAVKRLHERRKAEGKCTGCGERWAEPGKTLCEKCLEFGRARHRVYDPDGAKAKARRQARIAAGLCVDCGKPADRTQLCARCKEKHKDSWRKRKIMASIEAKAAMAREGRHDDV
jgi:hypothetical protein